MNIFNRKFDLYKVVLLCLISALNPVNASSEAQKNWQFKVFLDEEEIGFHHFSLVQKKHHMEVYSKARFNIKFLFFNAYSYQHDNVEHWNSHCLESINAVTDDNGKIYSVSGKSDRHAFIVDTNRQQNTYLSCVKTFAYWDPEFLKESSLLNSQTGEMIEIKTQFIGNETRTYRGQSVDARRYRLSGENLQIDLWYSKDDHWLALESVTQHGQVIKYAIP